MTAQAMLDDEELKVLAVVGAMGLKRGEGFTPAKVASQGDLFDVAFDYCTTGQKEIKPGDAVLFWDGASGDREATVALVRATPCVDIQRVAPWYRTLRVFAPYHPPEGHNCGGHVASMVVITDEAFHEVCAAGGVVEEGSLAAKAARAAIYELAQMLRTKEKGQS